jgi:hypothetical protein
VKPPDGGGTLLGFSGNEVCMLGGSPYCVGVRNYGPTKCDVFLYMDGSTHEIAGRRIEPASSLGHQNQSTVWMSGEDWAAEPRRFVAAIPVAPAKRVQGDLVIRFLPRRSDLEPVPDQQVTFTTKTDPTTAAGGATVLGRSIKPPERSVAKIPDIEIDPSRRRDIRIRIVCLQP